MISKNKNEKGVTLVEIIVAIFIISIFSIIVISDFPKIKKQFSLSRATYKLAQDIRTTEDLGLSGVQVSGASNAKGYGFYVNWANNKKQYLTYADVAIAPEIADRQFASGSENCPSSQAGNDCIIETIDILEDEPGVYIKQIYYINSGNTPVGVNWLSINFNPPNPTVIITTSAGTAKKVGITLGLESDNSSERTIYVNSSGLVEVK